MSLNEYQIISRLGAGSFGIVYRAKSKKNNQVFVIKEIQIGKMDQKLKKWSMNQAKIMKQITSPFIVKCFNSFVQTNKLYIVMEYCTKGDLANYIKAQMGKPIKEETIWKFTIQIMIGLKQLHSRKILHRDIKTMNIFLDQNFNAKVGDLGVAKTLNTDFTNTIVGTPYYLSPQMCEQKPYNQKTDVWAFGCLVYQLCTGKHPFQAQNQAALALKIVMGKFHDIPTFYSKQLRWLIHSCLSVDYKRRPTITYILDRPQIIKEAQKLSINIEKNNQKLQIKKQTSHQKKVQIIQVKKIEEPLKKIIPVQKPPIPSKQNIEVKKFTPQVKVIKRNNSSKQILKPQIKKQILVIPKNQPSKLSKDKSSKQLIHNKSRQKINNNQNPNHPVKVIVNNKLILPQAVKIAPPNKQVQRKIFTNNIQEVQKPKQIIPQAKTSSSNNLILQQKRKSIASDLIQKTSIKRQFNQQDQRNIKQEQCEVISNLTLLDMSKRKLSEKDQQLMQKQKINSTKKNTFVNNKIQQQVDDDLLMAQFGITPQKKEILQNSFISIKARTINWQLQESNRTQGLNQHTIKNNSIINAKYLPTVNNPSQSTQISVIDENQGGIQYQENREFKVQHDKDHINSQEDDNLPYKSDDQNEQGQQNQISKKQSPSNDQQKQFSSEEQDSRYLIQNIQAQINSQGRSELQKSIELQCKRQLENQKRLLHLQNQKDYTFKEYFSNINQEVYIKLRQQVNNENDKQVDKLMSQLTKGKQILMMKFLKIMGFQMQIQLCQKNITASKNKKNQLQIKLQKGEFI